jgi:hypothetical protein
VATWTRLGHIAGYVAGGAFLGQTALYLLDVTGVLAPPVSYRVTDQGSQQDLIDYYVSYHERMHDIWWDVALRDLLGPIGYLALLILIRALIQVAGSGKPREDLAQIFVLLGASAAALSDLVYLSHLGWWRPGGFLATPDMIAFGRAVEVADNLGDFVQWAGLLLLAIGLILVRPTLADALGRRHRLAVFAYLEAAALIAFVVANVLGADTAVTVAAVASGLILAPALAVLTGHAIAVSGL